MAVFDVMAQCDWMHEGESLTGVDGEEYDCLEQACAAAGIYCARISAALAEMPVVPPASMQSRVEVWGVIKGRSYLHAEWNLRDGAWLRVKP